MNQTSPALTPAQRSKGQRSAIRSQLLGGTIQYIVLGPVMLLFCTDVLRFSSQQIAGLLACFPLVNIPLLFITNRLVSYEKIRLLRFSECLRLTVVIILLLLPVTMMTYSMFLGLLIVYCLGQQIGLGTMWQPILRDITTTEDRGTFFSRLRFTFTLVTLGVTACIPLLLGTDITLWQYRSLMFLALIGMINRLYWSKSIPEVNIDRNRENGEESPRTSLTSLIKESQLLRLPLLVSICLQLTLSSIFILFMKKILLTPSDTISLIILSGTFGSLLSLLIWGRVVDLLGHRPVLKGLLLLSIAKTPLYLLLVPLETSTSFISTFSAETLTLWLLVFISFLTGFLMAGMGLVVTSLLHSSASPTQPVLDMKLFQIATSLAAIVITLFVGWVITMTENGTPFSLYSGFLWIDPYRIYLLFCAAVSLFLFFFSTRIINSRKHGDMNDFFQLFSPTTVRHFYASRRVFSEDEEQRTETARWMGRHHTASSIDSLLKMLNDPSYDVKIEAIRSLGHSKSARAAERLLAMLDDPNRRSLADHLCWALGKLQYQEGTSSLIQHCSDKYPTRIRAMAARSLGRMNDPLAISVLVNILSTECDSQHLLASACRGLLRLNAKEHACIIFDALCKIDHREERYELLEALCSWLSISSHWVLTSNNSNSSTYDSLYNELELRSDSWKRTHTEAIEAFNAKDIERIRQLLQKSAGDDLLRHALLNSLNKIDTWQPLVVVGAAVILFKKN